MAQFSCRIIDFRFSSHTLSEKCREQERRMKRSWSGINCIRRLGYVILAICEHFESLLVCATVRSGYQVKLERHHIHVIYRALAASTMQDVFLLLFHTHIFHRQTISARCKLNGRNIISQAPTYNTIYFNRRTFKTALGRVWRESRKKLIFSFVTDMISLKRNINQLLHGDRWRLLQETSHARLFSQAATHRRYDARLFS